MSQTANEIANEIANESRDEYLLTKHFEHFVRKWAPSERQGEFDADLFMLVRAIHADAAKPYEVQMRKMMDAASVLHVLRPNLA